MWTIFGFQTNWRRRLHASNQIKHRTCFPVVNIFLMLKKKMHILAVHQDSINSEEVAWEKLATELSKAYSVPVFDD